MATPMGYGTLLECPYNKSHHVQATAMARHLFKCRKMHPNIEFVTCPFNHAHKVAEPELKMHTATCDDRANFDMYKYCITTAAATHQSSEAQEPELIYNEEDPIAPEKVHDDDDECWDDLRIPAYNPEQYCAQAKIIRKATLMTPAEKRVFYEKEMERHRALEVKIKQEKGEDIEPSSSSSSDKHKRRPRSRSPVSRSRKRSRSPLVVTRHRSPPVARRRSRSSSRGSRPAHKRRSRSSSRESRRSRRRRSPSPVVARSRRSRSNSRKSRSLSPIRDRMRPQRSPSFERRRVLRSPSPVPDYRRAVALRSAYERLEERDRYSRPYYDYASRYEPYPRVPQYEYPPSRVPAPRYERDNRQGYSRDRDDEEQVYRRDFRD